MTTSTATNRLSEASYDDAGNLTSWGGTSTAWYPTNELRAAQGFNINDLYGYTADGERLAVYNELSTDPAGKFTITLRDLSGKVLRAFQVTTGQPGTWTEKQDWIYRDGQLLATVDAGQVKHFHLDHLGSPRLVTGSTGLGLTATEFHPFGWDVRSMAQSTARMQFTGHERDVHETTRPSDDLYYMHARYYNPNLGRFLSVDPAGGKPGRPQSWNRYAYALNNPQLLVDPDGRTVESALALIHRYRSEIAVASALTGGQVSSLEIARVVFQENREDYNWWMDADWTASLTGSHVGIPELKNLGGGVLFLALNDNRSFGVGEMKTATAASLLGLDYANLDLAGRVQLFALLDTPASALILVALELQRIKTLRGDVPDPVLLSMYNLGPSGYKSGVSSRARRSGEYILEIKRALAMDDGTAASTVVRCNGAYSFAGQCQ